jgi:AcrR family transcriptional regulator
MMNRRPKDVPERSDARSRRTHAALSAALVELMLEQDFHEIRVQDVLDRAGVGRSTFYSHFRNKEDFLHADAERFVGVLESHFLASAGSTRRVAPLAELVAHVGAYRDFAAALARAGKAEELWGLFVEHFARLIARRLAEIQGDTGAGALPQEMSARLYAAAAIELLKWWIDRGGPMPPAELDDRFHTMVWRGIAAA